jgi:hypothetical protein
MITSPNLYAGKNRKDVIAPAIYGGNTVTAGLWNVVPTMLSVYVFQNLNFADTLTAGNFCGDAANTASTLSDVSITLARLKADFLICKDNFRGTFLEDDYMPAIDAYVATALRKYGQMLENLRWVGNTASAIPALALQTGIMRQLVVAGTFIPVAGALAANILDPTKVIAELNKALAVVPANVRYDANFKIVMAPQVFSAFRQAAWSDGNFNAGLMQIQGFATNVDPAVGAVGNFYGIPVYIATALDTVTTAPSTKAYAHCVLMGIFSSDSDSNLIMATDLIGELGSVSLLDLEQTTGSENYRIKFEFKQGVAVAKPTEIVLYI